VGVSSPTTEPGIFPERQTDGQPFKQSKSLLFPMAAIKRIQNELRMFKKDPPSGCMVEAVEGDLYHWTGTIIGPPDTPYDGGIFHVDIVFPPEFPHKPPTIKFTTKVYHPNVGDNGDICIDTLKDKWIPAMSIGSVLQAISSLFNDPNPDHPMKGDIARQYKENRPAYNQTAREWTRQYANG
jgi:ubiquitin-conjugating enzyme E2 D/E